MHLLAAGPKPNVKGQHARDEAFSGNLPDYTETKGARRARRPLGSLRDIVAVLSAPGHRAGFHGLPSSLVTFLPDCCLLLCLGSSHSGAGLQIAFPPSSPLHITTGASF